MSIDKKKFDTKFYCIREAESDKIMGVSFSPEGLRFLANKTGRILLYRNAKFEVKNQRLEVVGDTRLNENLYIAPYDRIDHMQKYRNLKDSARLPEHILEKIRLKALQLNKHENFWEKAISLKLDYYKKYFHEDENL